MSDISGVSDIVRTSISMSKRFHDHAKEAAESYGIGFSELVRASLQEKLQRDGFRITPPKDNQNGAGAASTGSPESDTPAATQEASS